VALISSSNFESYHRLNNKKADDLKSKLCQFFLIEKEAFASFYIG
jgi:hypothetical protein